MPYDVHDSPEPAPASSELLLPAPPEERLLEAPGNREPNLSQPDAAALAMHMLFEQQEHLRSKLEELEKRENDKTGNKKSEEDSEENGEKKGDWEDKDSKDGADKRKMKAREENRKKRGRYIFWSVIAFIPLVLLGAWILWYLAGYENTDDAFIEGHNDPISTRIDGTVTQVLVENTFRVKKGQLLVELDPRDYAVARLQADADYKQAVAAERAQIPQVPVTSEQQTTEVLSSALEVTRLEAQLQQRQEQFRAAESDLRQAEANLGNAVTEEERYRQLVAKDEVSRERYDQKLTNRNAETALVSSRREQANAAQRVVAQTNAQLGQAIALEKRNQTVRPKQVETQRELLAQREAEAEGRKAQADQAELNMQYTRIYAPADGIIGDKQVQRLSRVAAGQDMFVLTETNDLWVTANFKETQIRKMQRGQHVIIHVDALDENFDGEIEDLPGASGAVYSLLPPENATGNYVKVVQRLPVRIHIRGGQHDANRLAPGMSVEPKVMFR